MHLQDEMVQTFISNHRFRKNFIEVCNSDSTIYTAFEVQQQKVCNGPGIYFLMKTNNDHTKKY